MKLGEHAAGRTTSPAQRDGVIDPATRRRMGDYVRRFWPGLDPEPVAERACLYTWTPSQDFLIARYGALVVCSACSGHAAKFTPLIGEWLADLVEAARCRRRRVCSRRAQLPDGSATVGLARRVGAASDVLTCA